MLYEIAVESGARVEFDSNVVSVNPESPSITLSSGEEIKADIVLGADGGESVVRSILPGEREISKVGPFSVYT